MLKREGNKSALATMVEVSGARRQRLIYLLCCLGVACTGFFGTNALLNQNLILGGSLTVIAAVGVGNIVLYHFTVSEKVLTSCFNMLMLSLLMVLLITGGSAGTGKFWIYPIVAMSLFINTFRTGLLIASGFLILSSIMLFTPASELLIAQFTAIEKSRFLISLTTMSVMCMLAVYTQDKTNEVMLDLHNNDIEKRANSDLLTGLANRWNFTDFLNKMIKRAALDQGKMALFFIDIDDFKQVNDKFGHQAGDELLTTFAECLEATLRPTDITVKIDKLNNGMARLAGDEFAVLLPNVRNSQDATIVAERLLSMFDGGFEVNDRNYQVSISVGVAIYPEDGKTAEQLLDNADNAMYRSKMTGKGKYNFFTEEMASQQRRHHQIVEALRDALSNDQFEINYMPIFTGDTVVPVGAEVLLRCRHPFLAEVGPAEFIPVAEQTGLIQRIDLMVLDYAFAGLKTLQQEYGFTGFICINISAIELHNESFVTDLKSLLHKHQVGPEKIELELTESTLTESDEMSINTLKAIKNEGFKISLDDFGTGYIAFNQLVNYPVDTIKIDRSFVSYLDTNDPVRSQMASMVYRLGKLYRLSVVAEGVENAEQLRQLTDMGCDFLQGFYLSKPLNFDDYRTLFACPAGHSADSLTQPCRRTSSADTFARTAA